MEFALFLFFLIFTTTLTAVISYYADLLFFHKKDVYDREEITEILDPVLKIFMGVLTSGGELVIGGGLFFGFALLAWLWSLLGGAVGTPHYTDAPGNYFFNAPLLFVVFLFGFPFLKEGFSSPGPLKQFFDAGRAVLSGLGLGAWSASLASWGLYHEFYFLFVLLSGVVVVLPLCYFWQGRAFFGIHIGPKEKFVPNWDEDIYAEPGSPPSPAKNKNSNFTDEDPFLNDTDDTFSAGPTGLGDWDDIEEGGLGDEPPSLDDFVDPK